MTTQTRTKREFAHNEKLSKIVQPKVLFIVAAWNGML